MRLGTFQDSDITKVNSSNTVSSMQEGVIYVLAGAWCTQDCDGIEVIGVSYDVDILKKQLKDISNSKARKYFRQKYGDVLETVTSQLYEIIDETGNYAKFYITEHKVK